MRPSAVRTRNQSRPTPHEPRVAATTAWVGGAFFFAAPPPPFVVVPLAQHLDDALRLSAPHETVRAAGLLLQRRRLVEEGFDGLVDVMERLVVGHGIWST